MLRVIVAFGREEYEYRASASRARKPSRPASGSRCGQPCSRSSSTRPRRRARRSCSGSGPGTSSRHSSPSASCSCSWATSRPIYKPLEQLSGTVCVAAGAVRRAALASSRCSPSEPEVERRRGCDRARPRHGTGGVRGRRLRLQGRARARSPTHVRGRARTASRHRRPDRRRQDDTRLAARALLRPDARANPPRRRRRCRASGSKRCGVRSASSSRSRSSSRARSRRTSATAGWTRPTTRSSRPHAAANVARLRTPPAGRLRHEARRARNPALRRRAPADLGCARLPQGRADPHPRRADVVDRLPHRGDHPRCARHAERRPDDVHDRAPSLDCSSADLVLVINEGALVERGTHRELIDQRRPLPPALGGTDGRAGQ